MEATPIHKSAEQVDREQRAERIREARLARLREFLEQARAEHCFDNELDVEDDRGRDDVEAIMALAETLSVQRRAGLSVGFAQALSGADSLKLAATGSRVLEDAKAELEREREQLLKVARKHESALEREQDAHRKTADALKSEQEAHRKTADTLKSAQAELEHKTNKPK